MTNRKSIPHGRLNVTASLNNTLLTFTDNEGRVVCWSSTGAVGFKGSRKSTPYASSVALDNLIKKMKDNGVKTLELYLKGPGSGRDSVLRTLRVSPFKITKIADITPLPHNGVRPRKQRHG